MLTTLIELQRLKRLDRTGWTLRGLPPGTESVAAHSFGVATTAMLLADELVASGVALNVEKILRLSLIHDWAEVRVGDLPKTATSYFGKASRREAEQAAFADIVKGVNSGRDEYEKLFDEYERRESFEARVVKVADILDLLVEVLALERAGAKGLDEFWEVAHEPLFVFEGAAQQIVQDHFESLLSARAELR
jgi:putative hydrolases of HD superfamily